MNGQATYYTAAIMRTPSKYTIAHSAEKSISKALTMVDVVPAIIEGLDSNGTDTDAFKDSLSQPDIDSQTNKTNTDMAFSAEPFFIYNLHHQSGINPEGF